jgi:hypothetical protein
MSRRRGVLLLAVVVVLAMVRLPHAKACTCSTGDSRDRLAAADGAFIGELVGRRETGPLGSIISSGRDVVYTFEVTEVFKGDIGRRVEIHSAASGMSCGFEVAAGEAVGVLLDRQGGDWRSGLCGQIEPGKLRTAAAPLPTPDGRAPARPGGWGKLWGGAPAHPGSARPHHCLWVRGRPDGPAVGLPRRGPTARDR